MAATTTITPPCITLPAAIRATQDIWTEEDTGQLFPTAAMRLWDHHLHTSGLLQLVPRSSYVGGVYEHDWVCTYHSICTFPHEALIELILEDGSKTESHIWVDRVGPSTLYLSQMVTLYDEVLATSVRMLTRKIKGVPVPFTKEERYRFENYCGADQMIIDFQLKLAEKYPCDDDITQQRQQPRIEDDAAENDHSTPSKTLQGTSASPSSVAEFPAPEHSTTSRRPPILMKKKGIMDQKYPKKRKMTLSSTLCLESFGTFLPRYNHGSFLLAVRVGPQHLDTISVSTTMTSSISNGTATTTTNTNPTPRTLYADTSWLAEIAFQALCLADLIEGPSSSSSSTTTKKGPSSWGDTTTSGGGNTNHHHHHQHANTTMAVHYRSVAMLGNELRCFLHGGDRVVMVRSFIPSLGESKKKGNSHHHHHQTVVLIAKAGPLLLTH